LYRETTINDFVVVQKQGITVDTVLRAIVRAIFYPDLLKKTSYKSIMTDVANAGAKWEDSEIVVAKWGSSNAEHEFGCGQ